MYTQTKINYDELVKAVSGEYRTLQDIANQFGVTRERVRQVINKNKLQNYPGRQKPDKGNKRITCSYCNEKVELGKSNQPRKAHPECVENAVWSEPTCHVCNKPFKIRTKVLNRIMARRTSAWTKDVVFCSKHCYGSYWGSLFGYGNKHNKRVKTVDQDYQKMDTATISLKEALPGILLEYINQREYQYINDNIETGLGLLKYYLAASDINPTEFYEFAEEYFYENHPPGSIYNYPGRDSIYETFKYKFEMPMMTPKLSKRYIDYSKILEYADPIQLWWDIEKIEPDFYSETFIGDTTLNELINLYYIVVSLQKVINLAQIAS